MKNVMSVRLDSRTLRRIRDLAKREGKEMSAIARDLMEQGWIFRMIREYGEGKLSLGTLADRLGVPLADAIDLLSDLGVRSPVEYDDYLKSYAASRDLFRS